MREMKKVAVAAAAMLIASGASAGPLSWTEVNAGYDRFDSGDNTTDGFDIGGSLGFAGIGHVSASYLSGSIDGSEGFSSFDFDEYSVKVGVHPSVGENTQLIAEVGYTNLDGDDDVGADGITLGFGLRHKLGDNFEATAEINYIDGSVDNGGPDFNDTSLSFGGRYYWMPNLYTGISMVTGGGGSVLGDVTSGDGIRFSVGWSFDGDVL